MRSPVVLGELTAPPHLGHLCYLAHKLRKSWLLLVAVCHRGLLHRGFWAQKRLSLQSPAVRPACPYCEPYLMMPGKAVRALGGWKNISQALLEALGNYKRKQEGPTPRPSPLSYSRRKNIKQGLFLLGSAACPGPPLARTLQTGTTNSPLNSCLLAVGWKGRWS